MNVDDRSNGDMLRIVTRETESKFQQTIAVLLIAFVKFAKFLNTLMMKYELRYKCWINNRCNGFICASLPLLSILL